VRVDPHEFSQHSETLLAVVVGAVLATLSGLFASHVEARARRRERQHDAALFMGEILSTLGILLDQAKLRHGTGEPFGPVTTRMLRTARREVDLYERRREQLYEIRDPRLRSDIHGLIVRLSLPLDGVLDATEALSSGPAQPDLIAVRESAFAFLMTIRAAIPSLVDRLGSLSGETIEAYRVPEN
jgi:hypothetical protein